MNIRIPPVLLVWLAATIMAPAAVQAEIVLNEFLASNDETLQDEDGDYSDWIELFNTGDTEADLGGMSVTDDADEPNQWTFPKDTASSVIGSNSYLVVFCSGKDRTNTWELHTNFKLGAGGGFLGLYNKEGKTLASFNPYPPQSPDRSYGWNRNNQLGYFSKPTPGAANGEGDWNVQASTEAGFYKTPFSVTLTVSGGGAGGATLRYTEDGSEPTSGSDMVSSGEPIAISMTTVLRAAVFGGNNGSMRQSEVATYTYIFLEDVIQQPKEIPGFPRGILRKVDNLQGDLEVPLDMEMDLKIVAD